MSVTLMSVPFTVRIADGLVGAVGDEREIARLIEAQTGGLFADLDGRCELRRGCLKIDDVNLVVGSHLQLVAILRDVDRIGNERDGVRRIDRHIDRRSDHRVLSVGGWRVPSDLPDRQGRR